MKWYEKINFYELKLINEETVYWWSELPLNDIKQAIAKEDFVLVSSGRKENYKEEDINTKVIRSVKDITKRRRETYREQDENFVKRIRLVRNIRRSKQPLAVQKIIKKIEKQYQKQKEQKQWDWYEKDIGVHIDVLMHYNEEYLESLLEKCEKIDLVS